MEDFSKNHSGKELRRKLPHQTHDHARVNDKLNYPLPQSRSLTQKSILNLNSLLTLTFIFLVLSIFSASNVRADVVSQNSGGNNEFNVGDRYVEGFFFGSNPVCGDGILDTNIGEQCDDGNVNSGDGCSSVCVVEEEETGGGGGAGGGVAGEANIFVNPSQINVNLQINTNTEKTIRITNLGTSQLTVPVSQQGFNNMIILGNTSLTIPSGQTVDLKVIFVAGNEPGIYTGKILIDGKAVLVSLNIQTQLLLFDSNIVVLNNDFKVPQGDELKTLVTLIPLGDPSRLDVTLNYIVKDYRNQVYLTKSETILVDRQIQLVRNFDTGSLAQGDYVIGLELVYPNGVAPSSAYFKVIAPTTSNVFGKIVLFLVILILVILILIIIVLLWRRRKKKQEEGNVYRQ